MKKKILLLFFALLGTSAWAGVQTTYVVTKSSGTCYKLDKNGELSTIASGFGIKFASADEVLSFASKDNTINWGFEKSNGDIKGFRIRHSNDSIRRESGTANDIIVYTLSVPTDYTIVSYTLGTATESGSVDAGKGIKISESSDMSNFTLVQKSEGNSYTKTIDGDATEVKFYLQHANGDNPIDVTLTVVVEAPISPREAIEAYLTEDKMAKIEQAGQYGCPKTDSPSYIKIKSIIDRLKSGADEEFTSSDFEDVKACYDAYIADTDVVLPEAGKFYRFYAYNAAGNKYLAASDTCDIVGIRTANPEGASYIWYIGEGNTITAYANGYQFTSINSLSCTGTAISFEKCPNTFGAIFIKLGNQRWFIQASAADDSNLTTDTSGGSYAGAQFFVEEVNELPIALRAAGDNKHYATLNLPVDVTLEGASAYAPTLNENNYFICENGLTEVPANTPVILIGEGESATATATINPTASTAETAETLSGTIQAIVNPVEQNVYVLSVDGDNNLGFYKYEGTNIPGFKAYYTDTATEANGFVLNFADDNITGIVSAENAAAAAQTHYDLQGRRVVAPQKGQLYIVNGKKVLY